MFSHIPSKQTNNYMSIADAAEFLGLKYHHTRLLLINDDDITCYKYGKKRVWLKDDIIAFQKRHFGALLGAS